MCFQPLLISPLKSRSKVGFCWDCPVYPWWWTVSKDGLYPFLFSRGVCHATQWETEPISPALQLGWPWDWLGQEFCLHSGPILVQFWKSSSLLTFHSIGIFSSLKCVAFVWVGELYVMAPSGATLAWFFVGRWFPAHSGCEVQTVRVQRPLSGHKSLRETFL